MSDQTKQVVIAEQWAIAVGSIPLAPLWLVIAVIYTLMYICFVLPLRVRKTIRGYIQELDSEGVDDTGGEYRIPVFLDESGELMSPTNTRDFFRAPLNEYSLYAKRAENEIKVEMRNRNLIQGELVIRVCPSPKDSGE